MTKTAEAKTVETVEFYGENYPEVDGQASGTP